MTDVAVQPEASLESLLAQVADQFLEQRKQGQEPDIEEYVARYPQAAELVRKVLASLQMLGLSRVAGSPGTGGGAAVVVGGSLGDFRIVREIGQGGMGVVYEAVQVSLGRHVALKVLPVEAARDAKLLARFRRESQAAAQLHHSNIVPVFEVGQHGDVCFYAMQYIQGQPLDAVIRELQSERQKVAGTLRVPSAAASAVAQSLLAARFEPARLEDATLDYQPEASGVSQPTAGQAVDPPAPAARSELSLVASDQRLYCRQVARIGLQVAEALAYAHGRGIVHRDIKPSNLLPDRAGLVWVSDFGLAKMQEQALTETGDLVGTVRYMAPERFGGVCDARADVYALGLTLYELLLLRPAFDAADRLRLMDQIRHQEPARPRVIDARIPRDLETLLMKAIEKDPRRRYPSAEAMAADLRRFLADEPIQARRIGPVERLGRWGRRNPLVACLSAAVVLVAALGFAGVFGQMQVAQANERQAKVNAAQANEQRDEAQRQQAEAQRQRDEARALAAKLQAALEQLRRTTYTAHMNLARHAWEAGDADQVVALLEQHRPKSGQPDLRHFEWYYLYRLCHAQLLTLKGHTGGVSSVAYSPDGKRLASASEDKTVKVWDAQTGQELLTCKGHTGHIRSVAYSPDGKRLASGSGTWDATKKAYVAGEVKVWDGQTGQELLSLGGHTARVSSVAYSPDGKRLASASDDRTVKVWDAQTGQELLSLKGHIDWVLSVAFSPDGKRLASGVTVWDAQTGQELLTLQGGGRIITYSPDGKRLATGRNTWDAQTGQQLLSLPNIINARRMVYSPDGKRLANVAENQAVKVWDAQTGQELLTLKGHTGGVSDVAFSPDGERLALASGDGTVKIWDATTSPEDRTFSGRHTNTVWNVAFSPDGKRLASVDWDQTVKVWDAQTGQELLSLKGDARRVAFSPDGKRLAGGAKVWDAQTGQELLKRGGVFSPDGKRLAGDSKVWDAQTGQELLSLQGRGYGLAFSPDGKRLAGGVGDQTVKIWDAQTGQELLSLKGGGDYEGSIRVVFSPDGKRLAGGAYGGTVKVWDAQTSQELLSFKGHPGGIMSVAFSPDGKRLATQTVYGVKVWDAQTGQETLALKGGYGHAVAFSPDGHRLVGAGDRALKIWDATPLPAKP